MMKNKKMILAAVALVAIVAIMAGVFLATRPETSDGAKKITISVTHGDGSSKQYEMKTGEEYLGAVLLSEGIAEGVEGPYGLEIHTVDGEKASWDENQSYWALYIGEDYATTGADGIALTDGGVYKLVYTIG